MPKWIVVSATKPVLQRRNFDSWWLVAGNIKSVAGIPMDKIPLVDNHSNQLGKSYDCTSIAVHGDVTLEDFIWQKG